MTFLFEKMSEKAIKRLEQDEIQLRQFLAKQGDSYARYGVVACNHDALARTYTPLHQSLFFTYFYSYVESLLPSFICVRKEGTIYLVYMQRRNEWRSDVIDAVQLLKAELVTYMALDLKIGISIEYQDRTMMNQAFNEANTASISSEHNDALHFMKKLITNR